MNKNKPKVIVIGLDGATFKNLRPWMEQGLLPNLKFLVDNGVSGELESTIPCLSSPAWTSFMTGVNPGKHGVFGFVKAFSDKRYKRELITSKDIKAKTIFEILSEEKKASIVINLPITYPPFKINGCMISCGLTTPSTDFTFTYPEDLFKKIGFKKSDYIFEVNPRNYSYDNKEQLISDLIKCEEIKKGISFKLMDIYDWDLFVLIFGGTDRLQHFYWHYIDPTHSKYNPEETKKFFPSIIKYYQKLDSIIGEFINHMDENTNLFIVSDHGFGPLEKFIALHKIFTENSFLYHKKETLLHKLYNIQNSLRGFLHNNFFLYRIAKKIIKKILMNSCQKESSAIVKVKKRLGAVDTGYWHSINWKKTVAYLGITEDSIYINLKEREPEGIINPNGEYQKTKEKVINLISNLYEPYCKRKIDVKIFTKEEIYNGRYTDIAPDLFFQIEQQRYWLGTRPYSKTIFYDSEERTGNHTKDGIFICYGRNFKKGLRVNNAQIMDIAPTILYLLREKIPAYIDGKILREIFEQEFLKSNTFSLSWKNLDRDNVSIKEQNYTKDEIEKVKKHLSDLGYF